MKLITFRTAFKKEEHFGIVIGNIAIPFDTIQKSAKNDKKQKEIANIYSYIKYFPESERVAKIFDSFAKENIEIFDDEDFFLLSDVKTLPPIANPPAFIDFGLTPRHLYNSAMTLLQHEYGIIVKNLAILPYYNCNHNSIIGDMDTVGWPSYSSYLDIEPELAIITGTASNPILGYTIFNDMSARDVQLPEMIGTGPARCKDFDYSNGIGPFIITPDEIGNPLDLKVNVRIGDRYIFEGNTSEYSEKPENVVKFLNTVFTLHPGTIIGMGTIPECTGLDNNLWLYPDDKIEINFEKIGTLKQIIPSKIERNKNMRWTSRPELEKFYL